MSTSKMKYEHHHTEELYTYYRGRVALWNRVVHRTPKIPSSCQELEIGAIHSRWQGETGGYVQLCVHISVACGNENGAIVQTMATNVTLSDSETRS